MPYQVQYMKQIFSVTEPAIWAGDFAYDTNKSWASRNSHNPWVWFATSDPDQSPHFTAWADDFTGSKPTDMLKSFHITFFYKDQKHKPVHVYYKIGKKNGDAIYSGTDANRAGWEKKEARDYVEVNWEDFDALAASFLANAFA